MKVITIEGGQNAGKTTLVRHVLRRLVNDGAEVIKYEVTGQYYDDFFAFLMWKAKKIVLRSIGDKLSYITPGIELATDEKADVLLNARTTTVNESEYKEKLPKDCSFHKITLTKQPNAKPDIIQRQNAVEIIIAMLSE